ncbi:MAG: propanediol utilization protein [Peptococcaceae bacterium BICA1-8]|nr:MAG: propanediol utilization protein [Peptococcaceae bacterium BICA1-8]
MKPIMLIAPYKNMYELAKEITKKYEDIEVRLAYLDKALEIATNAENNGVEVFITRGGTVLILENSYINCPVIEIPVTPYDVLKAIHKAKKYGSNICVIGFDNIIGGVENLAPILDIDIMTYLVKSEKEATECLNSVLESKNIDVLLGGTVAEKLAKEHGIPTVFLETSSNTLDYCINEARKILNIKRKEEEKTEQFKAILDYISEGIIAVNKNGEVTTYNPAAERIIGVTKDSIMGKKVTDLINNSKLIEVMERNMPQFSELQKFEDTLALTNRVPIKVNEEVVGAVATFEDVTKIQEYEQKIRAILMKKGHIAKYTFANILGRSKAILETKEKGLKYAKTESTILIIGDSGTGKEMFAQSIHLASSRSKGPFVAVNCAAIPENLLESELFGYEGGAFTGARKDGKSGLFTLAHGGTILLDEIAETPIELQARLLRVLQEREVRPIGSEKVIPVDVRVIAATNKSLREEVDSGKFRRDLYYRLNILKLYVPNLQERKADIGLLSHYFLKKFCSKLIKNLEFSKEAFELLEYYSWPGNIRELENAMESLAIMCDQVITRENILEILDDYDFQCFRGDKPLINIKKEFILNTLKQCNGNRTAAAQQLGISRTQLWRYLKNF